MAQATINIISGSGFYKMEALKDVEEVTIEGRVVYDWEAKISRLYTESAQELDDAKRKVIYHEIQKTAAENVPWITLVNARLMAVGRDRIDTIQYPALGEALWNIADLKVRD